MPLLRQLSIQRFKSLRDVDIEFGSVNLFIGGNGSGKSNVLEAIGLVSAALERGISESDLSRKGLRLSKPAIFKSSFKHHKLPSQMNIKASFDDCVEYKLGILASDSNTSLQILTESAFHKGRKIFGRSGHGASVLGASLKRRPDPSRSLWDQSKSLGDFPEALAVELRSLEPYAIYAPQTEFLRGAEVGSVANPPVGLHGEGLAQALRTLIQEFRKFPKSAQPIFSDLFSLTYLPGWASRVLVSHADPKLTSNEVKTGESTIFFIDKYMNLKRNRITAYDSSEGTLFLMFIAISLLHGEMPKIFALDNVDSALNPRMTTNVLKKIIKACTDASIKAHGIGPNQVFLTSHNPTALDAFDLFDDRTRVFVVRRNVEGDTGVMRLQVPAGMTREAWIDRQAGRSLSELWIEGLIPGALGGDEI